MASIGTFFLPPGRRLGYVAQETGRPRETGSGLSALVCRRGTGSVDQGESPRPITRRLVSRILTAGVVLVASPRGGRKQYLHVDACCQPTRRNNHRFPRLTLALYDHTQCPLRWISLRDVSAGSVFLDETVLKAVRAL